MGPFVVIEGLDGAGTTTQTARLVAKLTERGHEVLATREPTPGPVGRLIRASLRGDADAPDERVLPWLFAADRRDHLLRDIEPALARDAWVVCDRYYHSSLAYQSLTLPFNSVWELNHSFRIPDVTIFLRVNVDECLRRIADRPEREIFEEKTRLDAIFASYEQTLAYLTGLGHHLVVLDGEQPPDVVAELVAQAAGLA